MLLLSFQLPTDTCLPFATVNPDGKIYNVEPKSGTQTIKKKDGGYSVLVDGKDDNGKVFKMDLVAKVVKK